MAVYLSSNPQSVHWRNDVPCSKLHVIKYFSGMAGYALSLITRTLCVAAKALILVARLTVALVFTACIQRNIGAKWKECGKSGVAFLGSLVELFNGAVGVLCPPLAYKMDEWLYKSYIIQETFLTTRVEFNFTQAPTFGAPLFTPDATEANDRFGTGFSQPLFAVPHDNTAFNQVLIASLIENWRSEAAVLREKENQAHITPSAEKAFEVLKKELPLNLEEGAEGISFTDIQTFLGDAGSVMGCAVIISLIQDSQLTELQKIMNLDSSVIRRLQTEYDCVKQMYDNGETLLEKCVKHWGGKEVLPKGGPLLTFIEKVKDLEGFLNAEKRMEWPVLWQPAYQKVCT